MKIPNTVIIGLTMEEAKDLLVHLIVTNHMDCIADEHRVSLNNLIDKLMIRIVHTSEGTSYEN